MTVFIVSVAIALCVSFVCSLAEAALLSLTPSQVADLSARHPGIGAIWRGFKTNIERPIAVILILNTAAHTVGAATAGSRYDELFGDQWIWAFSLIFTFAMLQGPNSAYAAIRGSEVRRRNGQPGRLDR